MEALINISLQITISLKAPETFCRMLNVFIIKI